MSTPHMRIETANRSLDVQRSFSITDGAFLRLKNHDGDAVSAHFSHADARRIGEWFVKRYGLQGWVPAKGDTVRILPDAKRYDGDDVDVTDATRAEVLSGLDSDGEYSVKALDGDDMGEAFYVAAAFIRHGDAILPEAPKPEAPTPTPAPRLTVGTPAVIVTDDAQDNTGTRQGLPKGAPVVINGDMPSGSYRVTAHTGGALRTFYVRATDVALSLPAAEPKPTTPAALKVGDVVALKPGAKTTYGGGVYFGSDVTRVKVTALPYGGGGNYEVRNLDGTGPRGGRDAGTQLVGRAYLGDPITDAARPWAVGDEAIVTEGGKYSDQFLTGERVRLTVVNGAHTDGTRQVRASSLGRPGTEWYTRTDAIRRP